MPKKAAGAGENSKKAQGQARKAEAAAGKKAAKDREVAAQEDVEWSKGGKDSSKKYVLATQPDYMNIRANKREEKQPPPKLQKPHAKRQRKLPC
jgi:hypothetical protein